MSALADASRRLHVGCGGTHLPGWVNIDRERLPGVDLVANVTQRLAFENVEAVFGEHFLEHLEVWDALTFLAEVRASEIPPGERQEFETWIRSEFRDHLSSHDNFCRGDWRAGCGEASAFSLARNSLGPLGTRPYTNYVRQGVSDDKRP